MRFASHIALPSSWVRLLSRAFGQCADPAHLVLLLCALASTLLGAPPVAVALVILTLLRVLLLAAIETYTDAAQHLLEQVRNPRARVRRDGVTQVLDAALLVPGDVIELQTGSRIPADLRLFEAQGLAIDQTPVIDVTAPALAWANAWVTSGRGVGVVLAAGAEAAGSALDRIAAPLATRSEVDRAASGESNSPALSGSTSLRNWVRLDWANGLVLLAATMFVLAGPIHGADQAQSALAALTLLAMAWSVHTRLGIPLRRLATAHAIRRMVGIGVYVRSVDELHRLADVPAHADAVEPPPAHPVSTAALDDTDQACLAADVVFAAPATDIPRLALRAAQMARSAAASTVRVWTYGTASLLALLTLTVMQSILSAPVWPASVPLALHLVLLVLCATLAMLPVRGAASRVRNAFEDRRLHRDLWRIHGVWVVALVLAALLVLRMAARFEADRATALFVLFVLTSITLAWLATLVCGGAGWRLRRVVASRGADLLRLMPVSGVTLAVLMAAVHASSLQTALATHALTPPAWMALALLTGVVTLVLLAAVLALEPPRTKPRIAPTAAPPPALSAILIPSSALGMALLLAMQAAPVQGQESKTLSGNASGRPALTVTATTPQTTDWPQVLAANGNIAAWQEAVIGAEISNYRLMEVRVNVGDVVRKGQLLAQISNDTVAAELAQSQALQAEAEAQLAEAKANADRARSLQSTGALSGQQINQLLTAEQTAAARLNSMRAKVKIDALRLEQTKVLAPDDGVISARTATVGSLTQPGQELFRLIRGGRLEWRAEVTAAELARIAPGQRAYVIAPNGQRVEGRVRMVAPTVDAQSRTALVYVDLKTRQTHVRAGMFARGEFELGSTRALTLPQSAVLLRDGFSYVFVLSAEDRVAQKKVSVGRRRGDRIEILSGLEANARVVASGAGFLADGDGVRVVGHVAPTP